MGQGAEDAEAEVIIGVIKWHNAVTGEDARGAEPAEVIRFAPYLLARRGLAVAPPAHGA